MDIHITRIQFKFNGIQIHLINNERSIIFDEYINNDYKKKNQILTLMYYILYNI